MAEFSSAANLQLLLESHRNLNPTYRSRPVAKRITRIDIQPGTTFCLQLKFPIRHFGLTKLPRRVSTPKRTYQTIGSSILLSRVWRPIGIQPGKTTALGTTKKVISIAQATKSRYHSWKSATASQTCWICGKSRCSLKLSDPLARGLITRPVDPNSVKRVAESIPYRSPHRLASAPTQCRTKSRARR